MDDMLERILDIAANPIVPDSRIKMLLDEYHRKVAAKSPAPAVTPDAPSDPMEPVLLMPGVLIYLGGRVIIRQDAPGGKYIVSSECADDSWEFGAIEAAKAEAHNRVKELIDMGWADFWG